MAAAFGTDAEARGTDTIAGVGMLLLWYVFVPLVITGYMALMHVSRGQTLGQMALGIRVVTADGGKPGLGQALLRDTIGHLVAGMFCAIGTFWMLWDPAQQTWADKIGSTYVRRA